MISDQMKLRFEEQVKRYSDYRKTRVEEQRESAETAALMVETYAKGVSEALMELNALENSEASTYLLKISVMLCQQIDPLYIENRRLRSTGYSKLEVHRNAIDSNSDNVH